MDNNHDLEQAQQLNHQMRSIRSQWIRLVLARTVFLMMVLFSGLIVLSLYFYLIVLSNVIMAFVVTLGICSVLIGFALFTPINRTMRQPDWCGLFLMLYHVFEYGALSVIYFQSLFDVINTQQFMILTVLIVFPITCLALATTPQLLFGGRSHQFLTVQYAAYHLSSQITLIYQSILAMVVLAKRHNYMSNPFDFIFSI